MLTSCALSTRYSPSRYVSAIEKGEAKLNKKEAMKHALIAKIESSPNPWYSLNIPYGKTVQKSQYTKEEDIFIVREVT